MGFAHSFLVTGRAFINLKVNGKPHKWSFVRDGDEKQIVSCEVDGSNGPDAISAKLKMGLKDLLGW